MPPIEDLRSAKAFAALLAIDVVLLSVVLNDCREEFSCAIFFTVEASTLNLTSPSIVPNCFLISETIRPILFGPCKFN